MKKTKLSGWFVLALLSTLSASAADLLDFVWSGGISDSSVVVAAKTKDHSGTNACRLIVYSDTNFTTQVFQCLETTLATTNNNSVVKLTASTGLVANTTYFYRVEVNGVEDDTKTGRFTTAPPASGGSFKIAFANSNNDPDSPVYDWLKEYDPLFFLNTGDFHYKDINTNVEAVALSLHQAAYEQNLNVNGGAANQAALYRSTAFAWMWDDHDFGPNDAHAKGSSATHLTTPEAQSAVHTAYRQTMPHWPINLENNTNFPAGKAPIAQAFTIGRVRFILSDIRSQSEQNGNTAFDATLMGAEQKAWFKEELLKASGTYPLIVWLTSTPWNGAQESVAGNKWYQHTGERTEIANFLKDNHIRGFSAIGGDAHMAAIDDGSNTDYATGGGSGFPIIHAAPIGNKNSYKGGPYSEGANATTDRQYGAMEFEDRTNELVSTWLCLNGGSETNIIVSNHADNPGNPLEYVFTNSWPLIAELSPVDDAEGVAIDGDLVLTFNESVQKGIGTLSIFTLADDALVETIAVTSTAVTVAGKQMTINPASDLQQLTAYYITLDEGVATDGLHDFPGIYAPAEVDYKKWNFSTEGLAIKTDTSEISVPEGGANTFQVRLSEDPITPRTVSVAWVSGDADISVTGGASLDFDSSNWSIDQAVTLNAAQDPDAINGSALLRCSSSGFLDVDVTATESDNDPVLHIETSTNAVAVPEGGTNTFQVRLDAAPNTTVTVWVNRASGDTDITVSETFFFDAGNYSTWQPATLNAAEDEDYSEDTALIECTSPWLSTQTLTATEAENDLGKELPFTETFESGFPMAGTIGTVAGQHGWTGGGTVQDETAYAGTQALRLQNATASHTFDGAQKEISINFQAKFIRGAVTPSDAGTAVAIFHINTNGHLVAYSNETPVVLTSTTLTNGWHSFEAQLDYTAQTWDLRIDDTLLVDAFAFYSAQSNFANIAFKTGSEAAFFDEIYVANKPSDTDDDGIPNSWEDTYYGGETNAIATNLCANGINTILEAYIAGLNPTNANSTFMLGGFGNILQWSNVSERIYTVYWTSNLLSGFGEPWRSNLTGGVFTDTLHEAESEGFYKLEVELD